MKQLKCILSHFFFKAPLTRTDTLTLAGSLNIKNGNGDGNVSVSTRRTFSHSKWAEVNVDYCTFKELCHRLSILKNLA